MLYREVELKLEFPAENAGALALLLTRLCGESVSTKQLRSTYFDTRGATLWDHKLSLRLRSVSGEYIQTVKTLQRLGAGLFDRDEWESPISGEAPDIAVASASPLPGLVGSEPLNPVFKTDIERSTWRFCTPAAEIELAMDLGEVTANGRTQNIAELELELKRGEHAELFALAHSLIEHQPLRFGVLSKSERGYRLALGERGESSAAESPLFKPGAQAAEGFRDIANACLRQFRLNEDILRETHSPKSLHQARVAIRRLRSAISLFEDVVADGDTPEHMRWLREFSGELGEARNLDVFLANLSEPRALERPALMRHLAGERERAYHTLSEILASQGFVSRILKFVAWVECGEWHNNDEAGRSLESTAEELLQRQWRRVKRAGRGFLHLDPNQRHSLRIKTKKLRYACEFFAELFAGRSRRKHSKSFVRTLEQLQASLGDLNDLATADKVIERVSSGAPDPETLHQLTTLRGSAPALHAREKELVASAARQLDKLTEQPQFWS